MKDGIPNDERAWCLHLPSDLRKPTKILAAVQDRQMYHLVGEALRDYLVKHKALDK